MCYVHQKNELDREKSAEEQSDLLEKLHHMAAEKNDTRGSIDYTLQLLSETRDQRPRNRHREGHLHCSLSGLYET